MKPSEPTYGLSATEAAMLGQRAHAALEASASALPPDIVFRLQQSREHAVARHSTRRRTVSWLRFAGLPEAGSGHWMRDIVAPAMGIVMLALLATSASQFPQAERRDEMVDIDTALLSDDLPIDASLARGFGVWLDRRGNT